MPPQLHGPYNRLMAPICADSAAAVLATLCYRHRLQATPGVHFPDLDLTTTLLQPRWTPADLVR